MSEMFFFVVVAYRVLLEDEWSRLQHSGKVRLASPLGIL